MRQETIIKTYLTFDELNDKQKAKVLDEYRDINVDHSAWYECLFDDRETILKHLGFSNVEFQFSGFCSQGDGACFTASFDVPKTKEELQERIKAVKDYAPTFDVSGFDALDVSGDDDLTLEVYKTNSRYSHSNTVNSDDEKLTEFVRDFSNQVYSDLEKEYNYLTSDELVAESLIANEMEFDLDNL